MRKMCNYGLFNFYFILFFTKEGADIQAKSDLLQELDLMRAVGSHPNIVRLLGCCVREGKTCVSQFVQAIAVRYYSAE